MQEKSLKLYNTDKTFFVKISNKLTQLLMPTKFGINNIMISIKRSNLLKSYYNYKEIIKETNTDKQEQISKKYEDAYTLYLEAIDKYIMESLYKKVKNNMATQFEKNALSNYYTVVNIKDKNYIEYKYRKQKYLLELEYQGVSAQNKDALLKKMNPFYIEKMDSLYKGIIKNFSVQLADNMDKYDNKNEIYTKTFEIIEEYVLKILPIKMQDEENKNNKELIAEYDRFEKFLTGKLDDIDIIEKNMILLSISRILFTHSLPLVTAEKCYIKLLKNARDLLVKYNKSNKHGNIYNLILNFIEEYNLKILSTKVYWDNPEQRDKYKKFWNKYKDIQKITDENEKKEKREILFIKADLETLKNSKNDYSSIINIYKQRLIELNAMKKIRLNKIGQTCKYKSKEKLTLRSEKILT